MYKEGKRSADERGAFFWHLAWHFTAVRMLSAALPAGPLVSVVMGTQSRHATPAYIHVGEVYRQKATAFCGAGSLWGSRGAGVHKRAGCRLGLGTRVGCAV